MADLWDNGEPSQDDFANVFPGDAEMNAQFEQEANEAATEQGLPPVSEEKAEQPRDEQGRFAAKDSAEEDVPADAETPEVAEPVVDEAMANFLAKYGGDREKALQAAIEAQSHIGSLNNELGQLRSILAERYQQQQQPQYQPPQQQYDWETLIDENPAYAMKLAYKQGDETAYHRAAEAWEDISPGAPEMWYQQQQTNEALAKMAARDRNRAGEQMVASLVQKYPDLGEYSDKIMEIASRFPHELEALRSPDMNVAAPALESLYLKARSPDPATFAAQAEELARKQTEAELRVRDEAAVASATRSNAAPPPSREEQIAADWYDREDRLAEGWNI